MAIKYLKKAIKTPSTDDNKTRSTVQNILNDIEKRREEGIKEITKKFEAIYNEDMASLYVKSPDIQPRATEYISDMINLVKIYEV